MAGLPAWQLNWLQSVLNAAARLVYLAFVSTFPQYPLAVNWVPSHCPRLPLPERYRATVSCWWVTACGRHLLRSASTTLLQLPGSNQAPSSTGPSQSCHKVVEQSTTVDNIFTVTASVRKSAEDGTVPTIVRWRTLLNATEWTSPLTPQRHCSIPGRRFASLCTSLIMMMMVMMTMMICCHSDYSMWSCKNE